MPNRHECPMDLKRLRSFVTVAELGGVSRAAAKLHITQPALSRQIRDLQEELDLKLFERVGRRLVLTGEGEELLRDCRGLLGHAGALAERVQSLRKGHAGVLKIAVSPNMLGWVFPPFLRHYAERHPEVHVNPVEVLSAEQLAKVEEGEVHFAMNTLPADEQRFASCPLRWFHVVAAAGPAYPIGRGALIDIHELAGMPLLVVHSSFATRKAFDAACRLARLNMNVAIESVSPHALLELAEQGHGVAIVPSDVVPIDDWKVRSARISYRGKPLRVLIGLIWNKHRPLPRYAEGFAQELAAYMQERYGADNPRRRRR
jgi:DNA-binding transcriptional LysR family regulator